MADQQVRFQIVIDKDTGAVKAVATDLDEVKKKAQGVGADAKKASAEGGDAFKSMGGKVKEFAMGLVVAQLAFEGLKKIAQQNDAFQELQATFADTAKILIDTLQPAISTISKGLSGVITIIGGAAKALKAVAAGEFSQAGDIMAESIEKAAGIIEGRVKVLTKNMAEAANERLTQEQAHAQAVAALAQAEADRKLADTNLTADQRLTIIMDKAQAELDAINTIEAAKAEQLRLQRETGAIAEAAYLAKLNTIRQQANDQRKAVEMKGAADIEAVRRTERAQQEAFFRAQISTAASAAAQRLAQTRNVGEALKAGAAAEVQALASHASEYIAIQGAKAAASSFAQAAAIGGPIAGAAAAASTLAFYAGLAAVVGAAGIVVGGAISGGGGGGGEAGGGGAAPAVAAGGGGVEAPAAGAPTGGVVNAPAGATGGGGGTGAVQVAVYLDGDVLFRAISNATRDGRVTIASRAVVP